MFFALPNPQSDNLVKLMRKIGYHPQKNNSFSRRIGGSYYPRFHIYVRKEIKEGFWINLHLDQKRASYLGQTAHSADYEEDNPILIQEKERILTILETL